MFTATEVQQLRGLLRLFANRKPVVGGVPPFETRDVAGGGQVLSLNPSYLLSGDDGSVDTDAAGFTNICATRSGGFVTDVKYRKKINDLLTRCVSVDECCLAAWWCISNSWIESAQSCCPTSPGVSITRQVRLSFSVTSGSYTLEDLGLPDAVYLTNVADTLFWGGRSTQAGDWFLGENVVSGGLLWACDGSQLKVTLSITGFTGTLTVNSACTVSDTGGPTFSVTYTRLVEGTCPDIDGVFPLEEQTATLSLAVASWLESGTSDAATGVQEIAAGVQAPWDAGVPWKTEDEASLCCGRMPDVVLECCAVGSPANYFPGRVRFSFTSKTGTATNLPDYITATYDGITTGTGVGTASLGCSIGTTPAPHNVTVNYFAGCVTGGVVLNAQVIVATQSGSPSNCTVASGSNSSITSALYDVEKTCSEEWDYTTLSLGVLYLWSGGAVVGQCNVSVTRY